MPASLSKNFRPTQLLLPAILLLAAILRIIYLNQYAVLPEWSGLTIDAWYHHNLAQSFADGNIFGDTTYFRAPFYIYCLGLLYALFDSGLWVGRLFGLLIGLVSVGMTYKIGRRLFDRQIGLVAALIHAIYPIMIYFEGELLLDSLFTLTLQLVVHRFLVALESNRMQEFLYTGLFIGLAAITRPTVLVIVPLIIVMLIILYRSDLWLKRVALVLVGATLLIGPIFIRNIAVAGDPVMIASQGGINLYIGNNDAADGLTVTLPEPLGHDWKIRRIHLMAETEAGHSLTPGEVSSYWTGVAVDWIMANPAKFVELYATKLFYQFADVEIGNNREITTFLGKIRLFDYLPLSFGIILALAVAGLLSGCRYDRRLVFLLLFMLLYILATSLFFYNSRFRLPLLPYYMILAAMGVSTLVRHIKEKRPTVVINFGVIALVAFGSFYPSAPLTGPWLSFSLSSEARAYQRTQQYQAAMDRFRAVALSDPDYPITHLGIGSCFVGLGQPDSARVYYEREQALHPDRTTSYMKMAALEMSSGRYPQARQNLRAALAVLPYEHDAHKLNFRALGNDSTVTSDRLIDAVEAAAVATHDDAYLLNEAASYLNARGEYRAAERYLIRALQSRPPPIETDDLAFLSDFANSQARYSSAKAKSAYLLGFLAGRTGDIEKAVAYCLEAISLDPDLSEPYINLAFAYITSHQAAKADSVIRVALKRFPDNARLRQMINRPR